MLNPEGEVIEVLGKSGTHDTDIISIAREFDLKYKFPSAVLSEAENIANAIPKEEIKNVWIIEVKMYLQLIRRMQKILMMLCLLKN